MIRFIYSESYHLIRQEIELIVNDFKKSDSSLLNFVCLRGKINATELSVGISAAPFLCDKKLILLKNIESENDIKSIELLAKNLENVPAFTDLVWCEIGKDIEKKAFFKKVSKNKNISFQKISLPAGLALNNYIEKVVGQYGLSLDKKASFALISGLGQNFDRLISELEKICLFVKGSSRSVIEEKDIRSLIVGEANESIFKFLDFILQKNKKSAFCSLNGLISSGLNELYIISMLAYQFRALYLVKELADKKMPDATIAKELRIHPFVVKKNKSLASKHSYLVLEKKILSLYNTDLSIKTGKLSPGVGLDLLVVNLVR